MWTNKWNSEFDGVWFLENAHRITIDLRENSVLSAVGYELSNDNSEKKFLSRCL